MHAQKHFTRYDELPGIIKSYKPSYNKNFPAWAKMLYSDSINFKTIDALFTTEEGSGIKEEAGKETAIKRYYLIWRKAVLPFVREGGNIEVPTDMKAMKNKRTGKGAALPAKVCANANWSFAGPKETWWQKYPNYSPPQNEANWQVNVYSFDVAGSNKNILYAGTETGFVSKTTDKGLHWKLLAVNYRFGGGITAIAVHPSNPNVVYVSAGGQVHKSTNGGVSWVPLLQADSNFSADRLRIDRNNPNKIYASAVEGLFVTTNAGATWTKKINLPCYDAEIKPNNSNVVYAITKEINDLGTNVFHHYISTDGGNTFTLDSNFNFNDEDASGGLLAVSAASPQLILSAVLSSNNTPKIYKGVYNNTTKKISWNLLVTGNSTNLSANNWQGYYDLVFEVSPANKNVVYFGTSGLEKSVNGGVSFTPIDDYYGGNSIVPLHPDAQDMKIINAQEAWIATDGGMNYTTDAFTTSNNTYPRNNGLVGSDFWGFDQGWNEDLAVGGRYHNGNAAIGEFYQDKALSLGGGESPTGWILPGKSRHAAFDDLDGGHILPPSLNAYEEGRFPFTKFPSMYFYGVRRGGFLAHPNYSSTFFISNGNGIWKSTDAGASFSLLHDFGVEVWQLQISRSNPNVLYADTKAGLYRSADGGNTWVAKPSLTADPYGYDWWKGNLTFVISPFNENVVYACPQDNWPGNIRKIFRSTNGGNTWSDFTTPTLNQYGTKWLCIQPLAGNKDGIYLFTKYSWDGSVGGKVFFRSQDMTDWEDYSTNFPAGATIDFAAAYPFYRDGKLRAAGNMGIWETPLYEQKFSATAINPMVDKNKGYACARDTFYFDDYSIVNHVGATWSWSFSPSPQYISNANTRNPKVVFGKKGKYTVTERITQNGKIYSKTINSMIDISANACGVIDTVPGKAASFSGETYTSIPAFNLQPTNQFTFSLWIKPDSTQKDWSGLVMPVGNGFSLNLLTSMELRYGNYWWLETNAFVKPGQWNHVALAVEPDKATIYVNGNPFVVTGSNEAAGFNNNILLGTQEGWGTYRAYTGLMDELCFWNRSLTQNEIREQMHLVKTNPDTSLLHYYQFNETEGTIAFDKIALSHISTGAITSSTSTAPLGAGVSKRLDINAAGTYSFGNTGLKMNFSAGTLPNGEVCVTRINQNSQNSSSANSSLLFGKYWIVNNYGSNETFSRLAKMEMGDCGPVTFDEISNPSRIKLFARGSFDDAAATWLQKGNASQVTRVGKSSNITFTAPPVTSFGQFELQRKDSALVPEFIVLRAEIQKNKTVLVTWTINDEADTDHYVIERSNDGIYFTPLASQPATAANATKSYLYADENPENGIMYYRIQSVPTEASARYSPVVDITLNNPSSLFEVFPNPLRREQLLKTNVKITEPYLLLIYDADGRQVHRQMHTGNVQVKLNNLTAGVYFYTAQWSNGIKNGKFVVD